MKIRLRYIALSAVGAGLLSFAFYALPGENKLHDQFQESSAAASATQAAPDMAPAAPTDQAPAPAPAQSEIASADSAQESPAADPTIQRSVSVEKGDVIIDVLSRGQVAAEEQFPVATALSKVLKPHEMKPGQVMNLTFQKDDDNKLHLISLDMALDGERSLNVAANDDDTYSAKENKAHLSVVQRAALTTIDGSLYEAGNKAKIPPAVLAAFIRAYSYSVDFQRDIQPGDKFAIMYEAVVNDKGEIVRPGNILAAFLRLGDRAAKIYLTRTSDGSLQFFAPDGHSIRRSLLRTPVAAVKITSGFGMRVHPLLGYSKMHKGVDFGAPVGTPVFAAGDGVIEKIGWWGGYGKYIRIRHSGDMGTAYAHLSRFAGNIQEGSRVRQGQVIALTGSTGAVTGPHLHFEVLKGGVQVNPLTVAVAIGDVLTPKEMGPFKALMEARDKEMRELIQPTEVAVRNATNASKME